jgi:hypothetical protein
MKNIITFLFVIISYTGFSQSEITTVELKNHISYLASDSLKGRKPGTEGDLAAAEYIKTEFKNAGLTLMANDGFQFFNITTGIKLNSGNHLYINKFHAKSSEDNIPFPFSANAGLHSNVIFVGYGFDIKNDKITHNDYENINVSGKWVLILRGNPEPENKQSEYESFSSDLSKVMTAVKHKAAGVIFVSGNHFDKDDKLNQLKYGRGTARVSVPVIHVKRQLADKILSKTAKTINEIEQNLITEKKTNSFDTKSDVNGIVNIEYVNTKTQNIIGIITGSDPVLSKEYIVFGAHYDHLGFGGKNSGSRMPDTIAVHNGADDNASGVASLIEIAERINTEQLKPKRSIVFIAFGGEEMGLLGSSYFVENPLINLEKVMVMINLDMVGRLNDEKNLSIAGTGTAKEFIEILDGFKSKTELNLSYSSSGSGASDHSSFYRKNIPVLFFNTGAHQDYHTPFDDIEQINFIGQKVVTEFVYKVFLELLNRNENLTFTETEMSDSGNKSRNFKVTLGIMPGFGDTSNSGLRVDGTSKDGPAQIGGMLRGDIITAIDGEKVSNIHEYMEILQRLEKGQQITVDILRNGHKNVLTIRL